MCEESQGTLSHALEGAYFYAGDGDWSLINGIRRENETLEFITESVSYESVPRDVRERAYDLYRGTGRAIVHPDGPLNISELGGSDD